MGIHQLLPKISVLIIAFFIGYELSTVEKTNFSSLSSKNHISLQNRGLGPNPYEFFSEEWIARMNAVCGDLKPIYNRAITLADLNSIYLDHAEIIGKNIEKLLCLLPVRYFLGNRPMMFRSRSLQESERYHPRLLFFYRKPIEERTHRPPRLDEEQLIFSVNDKEGFEGSNALEILRFNPDNFPNSPFELFELSLNKGELSKANPLKCSKCHGIEPRPLWDRMDFWPGARASLTNFEGNNDELSSQEFWTKYTTRPIYRLFEEVTPAGANVTFNGVLENLNGLRVAGKIINSKNYSNYKFAIAGAMFGCNSIEQFLPQEIRSKHNNTDFLMPINLGDKEFILSAFENRRNNLRKTYGEVPQNIRMELSEFNDITDLLNYIERQTYDNPVSVKNYYLDTLLRHMKQSVYGGMNPSVLILGNDHLEMKFGIPQLRYIFESRGIGIQDWAMDITEAIYSFSGFSGKLLDFLEVLLEKDPSIRSPQLASYFEKRKTIQNRPLTSSQDIIPTLRELKSKVNPLVCEELKNYSLVSFNDYIPSMPKSDILSEWKHHFSDKSVSCNTCHSGYISNYTGPLFTRISKQFPLVFMVCANCHSGDVDFAPGLPFYSQESFDELYSFVEMQDVLLYRISKDAKYNLDHMPPILELSSDQERAIKDYLKSLEPTE